MKRKAQFPIIYRKTKSHICYSFSWRVLLHGSLISRIKYFKTCAVNCLFIDTAIFSPTITGADLTLLGRY